MLFLPIFAFASALGEPIFAAAIRDVLLAWPFGFAIVVPIFGVYKLSSLMRGSSRLISVLPPSTALFALLAIFGVGNHSQTSGLRARRVPADSDLFVLGRRCLWGVLPGVAVTGIVIFVVLMVYASARGRDEHTSWNLALILAVVGTLVTLGWALVAPVVTDFAALAFGVPGLGLIAVVWWATRAR